MDTINIIVVVVSVLISIISHARKQFTKERDEPSPPPRKPARAQAPKPSPIAGRQVEPAAARPQVTSTTGASARAREAFRRELGELLRQAGELVLSARVEPATARMADVLDEYVVARARRLVAGTETRDLRAMAPEVRALQHLRMVHGAIETFIAQRRVPDLCKALGDADEMARACYQPIFEFARASRLELTSAVPVCVFTPFELGIWTGFIPTGIAPLFLPQRFLDDVRWWPAMAHEIGHDFLAATPGAEEGMREELGLPPEHVGTVPMSAFTDTLSLREVYRVFGAFFEEFFCDVFAALMLGPAYGYTMIELFSEPHAPHRTATVFLDEHGRYDLHPPRLLRVLLCAHVMRVIGEHEAADEIMREWTERHGEQESVFFPTREGSVVLEIPVAALDLVLSELASRLATQGLDSLDGHALSDVPGLAHGPHQAAEARRVRDELLTGRVPAQHGVRPVMAGAVLAWRAERGRHDAIVALARRAIVGVTDTREGIFTSAAPGRLGRNDLFEAFILHTILAPPPGVSRRRRESGFLDRRRWP